MLYWAQIRIDSGIPGYFFHQIYTVGITLCRLLHPGETIPRVKPERTGIDFCNSSHDLAKMIPLCPLKNGIHQIPCGTCAPMFSFNPDLHQFSCFGLILSPNQRRDADRKAVGKGQEYCFIHPLCSPLHPVTPHFISTLKCRIVCGLKGVRCVLQGCKSDLPVKGSLANLDSSDCYQVIPSIMSMFDRTDKAPNDLRLRRIPEAGPDEAVDPGETIFPQIF